MSSSRLFIAMLQTQLGLGFLAPLCILVSTVVVSEVLYFSITVIEIVNGQTCNAIFRSSCHYQHFTSTSPR
ncbi:hypothetical protein QR685DRAFT_519210 [Neurospora intermedia]|uniref:Uncharacterized protein n=1 Tax=Neurospora intermedia TaxID=5142 RepID=A0ABR3DFI5_NEUIN